MAKSKVVPNLAAEPSEAIPPLESGDRLSRAEFERRYAAMPQLKKAELIEGVVFVGSPVRIDLHGSPHAALVTWLGVYQATTPGTQVGDNSTVRLDMDNEVQPDAFLRLLPEFGGQSHTSEDGYVEGAPELVAEVAASSASIDLHEKMKVYRRNGVREYVVWRVMEGEVDWFVWREGEYERLEVDEEGVYRSEVFPGLWLKGEALVRGDLGEVLRVLEEGLRSEEHQAFVARLQERTPRGEFPG